MHRRLFLGGMAGAGALSAPPAMAQGRAATPELFAAAAGVPDLKLLGREQIAMLVWPGVTALDLVGPYHFLAAPGATIHIVTTQPDLRPVPSDRGLALQPTVTMRDCPSELTVLFAPGGTPLPAARDPAVREFVRDRAGRARYVTSVCTGSLVLAAAGVLRGRRATSHWSVLPVLARFGANPTQGRVVRDGNIITGAGVSAGLDFGAALLGELRGQPLAEAAVLMAEYDPEPPFPGGSLQTARPEIARFVQAGLRQFVAEASALPGFGS